MAQVSGIPSDRREAGKFLKSPQGHYLAFRAYGGTLGKDTPLRLRIAVLYHQRERELEQFRLLSGATRELKPMGRHLLTALACPWDAASLSPDEEARQLEQSDIMGKLLVLDDKQCKFFKKTRRPDSEKKLKPRKKHKRGI